MALGMTYNQFWFEDVNIAKFYMEAHEYRIEMRNQELWLQGLYDYKAFKAIMDRFAYGMNGNKGQKPEGYIEYPVAITEREKQAEKERKIKKTLEWVAQGQKE